MSAPEPAPPPAAHPPGLLESVGDWWQALHGALSDTVDIAVLEVRGAAVRLGIILGAGVVLGVLVVSAWLLLVAALAAAAMEAGVSAAAALALAALANVALLWPLVWTVRWLARGVRFDATLRQLAFTRERAPEPSSEEGEAAGRGTL